MRLPASICDTWSQTCRSPDPQLTECHERQPFGYVLRQGEREHHTINVHQKSHPGAHLPESGDEGGLRWIPRNDDSCVQSSFCAVMSPTVADKGMTALYSVSQIGSRIPRRSPAVQVVLFQFFLFRRARLLLPRGLRTRCTGARRLNIIEHEKTKFRSCKISGLLLTRELALCALTTSAGFTENVWSVTCKRNQQRALLTHYWLF